MGWQRDPTQTTDDGRREYHQEEGWKEDARAEVVWLECPCCGELTEEVDDNDECEFCRDEE